MRMGVIESYASTLVGLVETDLRVSIGGHMLEDNDPIDEHGAERDAPFDVHLAAERATEQVIGGHHRRTESQAQQAFTVRIPDKMRVPGQTFEGITADGQRVQGRVPAGGAPDGEVVAFLAPPASPWGSWVDGIVQYTGNMLRKSRAREGCCSVHETKLD